jgi:Ca2+-dependent lipid-binding protein
VVEKIWRSIDPEFFTLIEDILEDTLQSVSPGFIVSCQKKTIYAILQLKMTLFLDK